MRYRKKPIEIYALQYLADKWDASAPPEFHEAVQHTDGKPWIGTLEGVLTVSEGDWIIRGVKGEFYPCKPDIFEATYDKVPEHSVVVKD